MALFSSDSVVYLCPDCGNGQLVGRCMGIPFVERELDGMVNVAICDVFQCSHCLKWYTYMKEYAFAKPIEKLINIKRGDLRKLQEKKE